MSDDKKVIFSMSGVTKTYKNANTPVLKNIYLSFFYGAKIGILGLNGSGKSTLLRIIAGVDKNYQGDVVFSSGYKVGYLEQEPLLDENKTVKLLPSWMNTTRLMICLGCLKFMKMRKKCRNSWTSKRICRIK